MHTSRHTAVVAGLVALLITVPTAADAGKSAARHLPPKKAAAKVLTGTVAAKGSTGFGSDCLATSWQWTVAGLSPKPTANDVPTSLLVTWSDGSSSTAMLRKLAGAAAQYSAAVHVADGVHPTGAALTWPAGTALTVYRSFALGNGPCAPATTTTVVETTTTVAETSTTVSETTTTAEETTTTT